MATTPALVTQTKLDNDATKDVKVVVKRKVTYVFDIGSASNVRVPYAVAVNGAVQTAYKDQTKTVNGSGGKITVSDLDPGATVTLYLNSDAHPSYRKSPVYAIAPGERDVIVTIKEKYGRHADTDTPVPKVDPNAAAEAAKKEDTYSAALTGDIWMKVTHKYETSQVDGLIPTDTKPAIVTAVKKIYDGLTSTSLSIIIPPAAAGGPDRTITMKFLNGQNPVQNINSGYSLLAEGLTRVHPAGYVALINATFDAGVDKVQMTSAWRPMLGSIVHRAGLGLDVDYVGTHILNREELRDPNAIDTTNVSQDEKTLFAAFEQAQDDQAAAKKKLTAAKALVAKTKTDPEKIAAAKKELEVAAAESDAANTARKDAETAWNEERDKNEPNAVRLFRGSLMKCKCVAQIFDPWLMDTDNRDASAPAPNVLISSNETTHRHHLHISVHEPKIL